MDTKVEVTETRQNGPIKGHCQLTKQDMKAIEAAGAEFKRYKEEGGTINLLSFDNASTAHHKYVEIASTMDPVVYAAWVGRAPVGVVPPLAQQGQILLEANSVIVAYEPLLHQAFAHGAPLPVVPLLPPPGVPPIVRYRHAQHAITKLLERIANPGVGLPTIHGLGGGTFICHVHYHHANCTVIISVYRSHSH